MFLQNISNFYHSDMVLYTVDCIMDVDCNEDCMYCTDTPELTK